MFIALFTRKATTNLDSILKTRNSHVFIGVPDVRLIVQTARI